MTKPKTSNSHFIQFDTEFATCYGLNEAILAGKISRLQSVLTGKTDDDGIKWVRMTLSEWLEELPFMSEKTIRRTIESLEEQGLLLSTTFSGRSKWYRLADPDTTGQNDHIDDGNWSNRPDTTGQNDQLPRVFTYKDSTTDSTTAHDAHVREENTGPGSVDPIGQLVSFFHEKSGVPLPRGRPTVDRWVDELSEILADCGGDLAKSKSVIETVLKELGNGYNIRSPASILGPCAIEIGKRARGPSRRKSTNGGVANGRKNTDKYPTGREIASTEASNDANRDTLNAIREQYLERGGQKRVEPG